MGELDLICCNYCGESKSRNYFHYEPTQDDNMCESCYGLYKRNHESIHFLLEGTANQIVKMAIENGLEPFDCDDTIDVMKLFEYYLNEQMGNIAKEDPKHKLEVWSEWEKFQEE